MRVEIPNQITVTIGGLISRGVKAVEVTDAGKLIFTLTDGSVIDLGSVMGPQGPKGETGATGPQGQTGPQGAKGDTGAAGASITSITKKSQSGTTATYTMKLSDGKEFDFEEIKKEYDKVSEKSTSKSKDLDSYEINQLRALRAEEFERMCLEICQDEQKLCNIIVDLCYASKKGSKQFAWTICGDTMIDNLLKRNNYIINYLLIPIFQLMQ